MAWPQIHTQQPTDAYRLLFEHAPCGLFINQCGRFAHVNRAMVRLLGARDADELIGRPVLDHIHPDHHAAVRDRIELLLDGQVVPPLEEVFIRLDGTTVDVEVVATPCEYDGQAAVQVAVVDITDRKRAASALRHAPTAAISPTLLQSEIVDSLPTPVCVAEPSGLVVAANAAWADSRARGHAATVPIGANVLEAIAACVEGEPASAALAALLAGERDDASGEFGSAAEHETRWFRLIASPIRVHGFTGATVVLLDVTESVESAAAMRHFQDRYLLVARATSDIIWDWDLATNRVDWNEAVEPVLGWKAAEFGSDVESWTSRIHPDDHGRVLDSIHGAIEGDGETWSAEYRFRRRSGAYGVFYDRGFIARDRQGRGVRMIGSMLDLTEQMRAAADLRESRERLAEAQRIGRIGNWELDPSSGGLVWSDEMFRLLDRDPALGPPGLSEARGWIDDPAAGRFREVVRDAVERGEPFEGDLRLTLPSGRAVDLLVIVRAESDDGGGIRRVIGTVQDITDRKRADRAVRESEARYRNIVETAHEGIWLVDSGWRTTFANARMAEILGTTPEVMAGRHLLEFIPDSEREHVAQMMRRRGAGLTDIDELPLLRSDGARVWALASSSQLRDDTGREIGALAMVTDITQRRLAEEALLRRTEALERSNRELERFAYVASHDLQEPLRMVTSFTQLLARRYGGRLDADADEFIGFAVEGATRMQHLIEDLLAYSRVSSGEHRLEAVDTGETVREVLRGLRSSVERAGAEVCIGELPRVMADRQRLVQVFQNLISNAIKFRSEAPPRVEIGAEREPDGWRFSVSDNGIGIDPRHRERLFRMFQRLHGRESYPGNGIGLALCKMIVERRGGRIWVESATGAGCTFRFTVPDTRPEDTP